jgi:hypothetical protein
MRKSAIIGIAVYFALVGGVIGGAYAAFEGVVGIAPAQTASLGGIKQGPGAANSRKWTPVEIKREVAQRPRLAAYVAPSTAARARGAKKAQNRAVMTQRAAPARQQLNASAPVQLAYAPVEEPRSSGSFSFKF